MGHRGILFANKYELIGLPSFTDPHWDKVYAAAQEMELSINFHVGFSASMDGSAKSMKNLPQQLRSERGREGHRLGLMSNADSIAASSPRACASASRDSSSCRSRAGSASSPT